MHNVGFCPTIAGAAISFKSPCCKCSDDHKAFWFQPGNDTVVTIIPEYSCSWCKQEDDCRTLDNKYAVIKSNNQEALSTIPNIRSQHWLQQAGHTQST